MAQSLGDIPCVQSIYTSSGVSKARGYVVENSLAEGVTLAANDVLLPYAFYTNRVQAL